MNLIKKLAIGATTGAILLSSVAPAFASARAWNGNVSNRSTANSRAYDNDRVIVESVNIGTFVLKTGRRTANTGGNTQNNNTNASTLRTGDASVNGIDTVIVNEVIVDFKN